MRLAKREKALADTVSKLKAKRRRMDLKLHQHSIRNKQTIQLV